MNPKVKYFAIAVTIFLASLLFLFLSGPRIPLTPILPLLATAIEMMTKSEVILEGTYYLKPGKQTQLSIENGSLLLQDGNGALSELSATAFSVSFHLLPIFRRSIHLDALSGEAIHVRLSGHKPKEKAELTPSEGAPLLADWHLLGVDSITLSDLILQVSGDTMSALEVESATGSIPGSAAGVLTLKGSLNDLDFSAVIDSPPRSIADISRSLPFFMDLEIVGNTIRLDGQLEHGHNGSILHSDFTLKKTDKESEFAGATGNFHMAIRSGVPEFSVEVSSGRWDLGATLERFGIVAGAQVEIQEAVSIYRTSGISLDEMIHNLEFDVHGKGGKCIVRDPNTKTELPILIENVRITGSPKRQVTLVLEGEVEDLPFALRAEIDDVRGMAGSNLRTIPYHFNILLPDLTWEGEGTIPFPVHSRGIIMHWRINGSGFGARLGKLLGPDILDIGPLELSGTVVTTSQGYDLKDFTVQTGQSTLAGNIVLNTASSPLNVSANIVANSLQLKDFLYPSRNAKTTPHPSNPRKSTPFPYLQYLEQLKHNPWQASINLEVHKMYHGDKDLGNARLKIEQRNHTLSLSPFSMSFADGTISAHLSILFKGDQPRYDISVEIDDLDYGILASLLQPDANFPGTITLHASLHSPLDGTGRFLSDATGFIDFAIRPKGVHSGLFDLWAINLFSHLLPILVPEKSSQLNCVAGVFDIQSGTLEQREILIDTSQVQVKGTVEVDFKDRTIDALLRPIPKRPQFYSLATPVQVIGNLDDFKVGIARGGLIGTAIRLATSYIVVPIQWIILEKKVKNGVAECMELMKTRSLEN